MVPRPDVQFPSSLRKGCAVPIIPVPQSCTVLLLLHSATPPSPTLQLQPSRASPSPEPPPLTPAQAYRLLRQVDPAAAIRHPEGLGSQSRKSCVLRVNLCLFPREEI
eukprot:775849-Rhodomonas_salina.1